LSYAKISAINRNNEMQFFLEKSPTRRIIIKVVPVMAFSG
jgi:hypothetical protein